VPVEFGQMAELAAAALATAKATGRNRCEILPVRTARAS
jgi:PleD family two-component response regulator